MPIGSTCPSSRVRERAGPTDLRVALPVTNDRTMTFDLSQSLDETTFAILDVETTGLSPTYSHRVCEIACLRVRDGVELDRFESLIDPQRLISPGALWVNGITPEMLRGAPTFGEVVGPLLLVMRDAVLVAHNAPLHRRSVGKWGAGADALRGCRGPGNRSGDPAIARG